MKKMLIAAHGRFAEGMASAAELILGSQPGITYINAFVGDIPLEEMIENYFEKVKPEDQVIVLTDAFAGSVNQKLMERPELGMGNMFLVTGSNLPLVLELALCLDGEAPITEEWLEQTIDQSRRQLMLMNLVVRKSLEASGQGDDFTDL